MGVYSAINTSPTAADRFRFGALLLAASCAFAAYQYFGAHRSTLAAGMVSAGVSVFALSFVRPAGRVLYIGWMGLGLTIGLFTQPVVMAIVYTLVFVPLGLLFRAMGRDAMRRKIKPNAASYWEDYPEDDDPASHFRQY